ncbi:ribonuclease activity regulator RraA [Zeaxanthinibacter sp. PT1]|uniref:ribonuclease activity regulator RraA n=1 Tax=Zeaxanthinibacter TaxID=561554 RepID=UPI00234AEF35|nr:ribonuclease activity regulator RraA [Zeaxanthinibacter sp. PT1]MDC6352200.1 ribonuclease activity regulator RraA [Zeaxanthinibacter sp. PT1]
MANQSKTTIEKLQKVSTATVATCLFKKGLRNQYIQNVFPLKKMSVPMVGQAYTLRYIPAREDLNPIKVFKDPKHLQRVAVEECPAGQVLVIDSRQDPRAASAGSILATRLMQRGVAGLVTDGGFRDSEEIAQLNMPSFHVQPSAPTNLTLHQAIAINDPIGCGGVAVFPGDYIMGDEDGVMVIPQHMVETVADECLTMTEFEDFVMEKVRAGSSVIGLYPPTAKGVQAEFQKWQEHKDL